LHPPSPYLCDLTFARVHNSMLKEPNLAYDVARALRSEPPNAKLRSVRLVLVTCFIGQPRLAVFFTELTLWLRQKSLPARGL
jgi:hypothetical protein